MYDRDIPSNTFYSNYIQTYIEKDSTELIQVRDSRLFRNFLSLCATRAGQVMNLNNIAKDCGITQPTAKAWLSVLETSYICYQLQPFYSNLGKRVIKSPKLYFYDSGLLSHLLKIRDGNSLMTSPYKGNIFENMMMAEYMKINYHNHLWRELTYWRDAVGHEVDLIWQEDEKINLVEIKATETIMGDLFKGMDYFEKISPKKINSKTLVYGGDKNQVRTNAYVNSWREISLNL
jgi:predicted AAA+ superfamily ATPase